MKGSLPIKVVCFDLGGVLVRLSGTWTDCCRLAGAPVRNIFSDYGEFPLSKPALDLDTGRITDLEFAHEVCRNFPEYTPAHVTSVLDVWLNGLYVGVGPLLEMILTAGIDTACLSNTNHRHWELLTSGRGQYAELSRIRQRFASCDMGIRKPAKMAYTYVQRELGVDPQQIVFFDDRAKNIEVARRCGWYAFRIDPGFETVPTIHACLRQLGVL